MPGTLNVGGHNIITHSGTSGAGTINLVDQAGNTILTDSGSGMSLSSNVTFPAGHIIQSQSTSNSSYTTFTDNTYRVISGFVQTITVKSSNSKMLITLFLAGSGAENNTALAVKLTESITGLDQVLTEISGYTGDSARSFDQITLFYEHTHNQTAGTSLTYTPKFRSELNVSQAFVNNYIHTAGDAHSVILVQELMV